MSDGCFAAICAAMLLFSPAKAGAETIEFELERSDDRQNWERVPVTPGLLTEQGRVLQSDEENAKYYRLRIKGIGEDPPPEGFARIPPGSFMMGSPAAEITRYTHEGPQHQVTLTRAFYMQQTEVTWAQWHAVRDWATQNGYTDLPIGVMGSHGDSRNVPDEPVTMVSWYDVVKWLNAKSEREGLEPAFRVDGAVFRTGETRPVCDFDSSGYRLPTEAEWEYAARAGTTTAFYSGPITQAGTFPVDENLDRIGWYWSNSDVGNGRQTHPVGQKEPNSFGLYDMSGNVREWCWDLFQFYTESDETDPTGASVGLQRIHRGGSWFAGTGDSRSAHRWSRDPGSGYDLIGFRPARTE